MLKVMKDLDTTAAKLLEEKALPLGIDVPIVLGKVFPETTPEHASSAMD